MAVENSSPSVCTMSSSRLSSGTARTSLRARNADKCPESFVPILPRVALTDEVLLRYIERNCLGLASWAISYETQAFVFLCMRWLVWELPA